MTDALKRLRYGYVPYSSSLEMPGDRRRFVHYARRRGLDFEIADPSRAYDAVVLSDGRSSTPVKLDARILLAARELVRLGPAQVLAHVHATPGLVCDRFMRLPHRARSPLGVLTVIRFALLVALAAVYLVVVVIPLARTLGIT